MDPCDLADTGEPARYGARVRAFRFGFQIRQASADELRDLARRAEAAGFDVLHTWDHVVDGWAPLAPLLAAADCTTRLRVCPLVLNNDFHHPVHLAREPASIDHLSGGRLEVGRRDRAALARLPPAVGHLVLHRA